ncbi:MAG: hypothetical protein K2O42_02535 [Oscillospiraceae bacterium]|nr:hypothetical protein [Oscillospiraceae bacterium]
MNEREIKMKALALTMEIVKARFSSMTSTVSKNDTAFIQDVYEKMKELVKETYSNNQK